MSTLFAFKGQMRRVLFPSPPKELGEADTRFGIVLFQILEVTSIPDSFQKEEVEELKEEDKEVIATIAKFKPNQTIAVKGHWFSKPSTEATYKIVVKGKPNPKYGTEFNLQSFREDIDILQLDNQKALLRVFISEARIDALYNTYPNPLEIIHNHDINKLTQVSGIGETVAKKICARFESTKDKLPILAQMYEIGISENLAERIIKAYGHDIERIKYNVFQHPYNLVKDIKGVGFATADKIALKNGISERSPDRIAAFIIHTLYEQGDNGNSFITSAELTTLIFNAFGGQSSILEVYHDGTNNIGQAIEQLESSNILYVEPSESKAQRRVYLKYYYQLEKNIAYHLHRLQSADNVFGYAGWEDRIKELEERQGWAFTAEQYEGIRTALSNQVCFITGGSGTGKTSLVAGLLHVLQAYSFAQTALAGKAAARLSEVTNQEGYTIHRLLKFNGVSFEHTDTNPLPYDIIILDEISLVGGEIFLSLIKAIKTGAKLIMLGDQGQLPSIGCLNLAHDIHVSPHIPLCELTKIHRQAQKSGIITSSVKIREEGLLYPKKFVGQEITGELQDMEFDIRDDATDARQRCMEYFKKLYHSDLVKEDTRNIQVLIPIKNRGKSNVFLANLDIQEYVNPPADDKEEYIAKMGDVHYPIRVGDKVMCIRNNYRLPRVMTKADMINHPKQFVALLNQCLRTSFKDIEAVQEQMTITDELLKKLSVGQEAWAFNGWTGYVTHISQEDSRVHIYFDIPKITVSYSFGNMSEIELGYASTVHKYQGSSAKAVIGVVNYSTPPMMLNKELVYTLITRAEKYCVLIGENSALYTGCATSGIKNKNTFLQELLVEMFTQPTNESNCTKVDNFENFDIF